MTELDDASRLIAIEEIRNLKARYFRLMDTKEWDEWAHVFAEEVVVDVSDDSPGSEPMVGRKRVAETISSILASARTRHYGHMPEITVHDATHASGIWSMEDEVEFVDDEGNPTGGIKGCGHYHEEYVVENGSWRIASMTLRRLRVDPL